ncbi:MAG: hypothetical protein M3O06_02860 [Pseudomonadota bacterium]|nr:hypothetical protein [Pseudomonadota bacterium]
MQTLLIILGLVLSGCHGDNRSGAADGAASLAGAPAAAKRGPTVGKQTAGMIEAVTNGKSTVPVGAKFELTTRPVIGQPLDMQIAILPQIPAMATVTFTAAEGLRLDPGAVPINLAAVEAGQVYRVSVTATPLAQGVHSLGFEVLLTHGEARETRSFSIPVIVTETAPPAASAAR